MNAYTLALLGGGLIGLSASLLLIFKGRIFGVSGILAGLVVPEKSDFAWKVTIVAGLIFGGVIITLLMPEAMPRGEMDLTEIIPAGLLVGFGTQLGGGCTSGHGICGISRLSVRSLIATLSVMVTGMISASIFH